MKDLITAMGSAAILLAFLLQFTQNQVIFFRMITVEQEVNAFKEVCKQDGCITKQNEKKLRKAAAEILSCSAGEVRISGTKERKKRGERIHIRVTAPVRGVIGASSFWGIRKRDNQFRYVIDRYTTSEYIGRIT